MINLLFTNNNNNNFFYQGRGKFSLISPTHLLTRKKIITVSVLLFCMIQHKLINYDIEMMTLLQETILFVYLGYKELLYLD